jgi:hypothetical protein
MLPLSMPIIPHQLSSQQVFSQVATLDLTEHHTGGRFLEKFFPSSAFLSAQGRGPVALRMQGDFSKKSLISMPHTPAACDGLRGGFHCGPSVSHDMGVWH